MSVQAASSGPGYPDGYEYLGFLCVEGEFKNREFFRRLVDDAPFSRNRYTSDPADRELRPDNTGTVARFLSGRREAMARRLVDEELYRLTLQRTARDRRELTSLQKHTINVSARASVDGLAKVISGSKECWYDPETHAVLADDGGTLYPLRLENARAVIMAYLNNPDTPSRLPTSKRTRAILNLVPIHSQTVSCDGLGRSLYGRIDELKRMLEEEGAESIEPSIVVVTNIASLYDDRWKDPQATPVPLEWIEDRSVVISLGFFKPESKFKAVPARPAEFWIGVRASSPIADRVSKAIDTILIRR